MSFQIEEDKFPTDYIQAASEVAPAVKNLPVNAGDIRDLVRSLGQEDLLEEGMAWHGHCSILAWRIHGQRSLAGYHAWGHKESDRVKQLSTQSEMKEIYPR